MDRKVSSAGARLDSLGLLSCEGDDARTFLHAQLTSDVADLAATQARRAGWCSAKGRLMATLLVVPHDGGFLLSLSRDLAPAVAKRLSMFVLRAKAKVADVSDAWMQLGCWGPGAEARLASVGLSVPQAVLGCATQAGKTVVRVSEERFLVIAQAAHAAALAGQLADGAEDAWALEEIRDGQPRVVLATQDHFVPQMVNLERLGAVDFHKGCYPGQEIVARTQYRGVLKRRMVRARADAPAAPGDEIFGEEPGGQPIGVVANAAASPDGGSELLAVLQISAIEGGAPMHLRGADGPTLALLALPYA